MPFTNLSGTFGSNTNRNTNQRKTKTPKQHSSNGFFSGIGAVLSALSPERWVDISCISAIAIFLIVIACTWKSFSDALFLHVLFPIICILSGILTAIAVVVAIVIYLSIKINRRRYWW